jgi:Zn-dependent peptidase ImmA (M78 family)
VVPEGVRFRSKKRLKLREQVIADAGRALADYAELEELLGQRVPFALDAVGRSPRRSPSRAKFAAQQARAALGLDEKEPIRDICGLLEAAGVKVISVNVASDAFFGLSVSSPPLGPADVVNVWERISVERWIFTAAHELGHLLLHRSAYSKQATEEDETEERQANEFASLFLVPAESFATEWRETYGMSFLERVLKLKRMFRVSYQTILYRLYEETGRALWPVFHSQYQARYGRRLDHHREPEPVAEDAFRGGFPVSLRAEEPDNLSPSDFAQDRRYRLVRESVEKEIVGVARAAEILELSLVQMRDLTRSWVDVWDDAGN